MRTKGQSVFFSSSDFGHTKARLVTLIINFVHTKGQLLTFLLISDAQKDSCSHFF